MGTNNSKELTSPKLSLKADETINQASNLSPLQNAVLYKKYAQARLLLAESDDVTEVAESGLTLLHLVLVQNPPKWFSPDRYYDYMCENKTQKECQLVREIVELLCSRGASLQEDNFKMNPLEALYYSSQKRSVIRYLENILTRYVGLTCTDLLRYSACQLVYHRCDRLINQVPTSVSMMCCTMEGRQNLLRSMVLSVKHGINPGNIPGKLTPVFFSNSHMSFAIHDTQPAGHSNILNVDYVLDTFKFLEYKLAMWQQLWNMSDPLLYAFHPWIVSGLISNIDVDNVQGTSSRELLEILITSWLAIPSHLYHILSGEVLAITRHLYVYLSSITKKGGQKIDFERVVNLSKLNQFLHLLVAIMSVMKNGIETDGVKLIELTGYYLNKLLIIKYEVDEVPYEEMELLSKSLSNLYTVSHIEYSYFGPMLDYQNLDPGLDKREFLRFLAPLDPNLNERRLVSGRTPLHDALLFGDIFLIQALMEGGANPFTVDREGNSFIEQLNNIINSFNPGLARQLYEETRDRYIILNPPFPLLTLAANTIVRQKIPFHILTCQPRLYNMLLSYLPPS